LLAQTPSGINYQTVIRDGAGDILPDTELTLQMIIRSGAPDGAVVYQETHAATTNAFGLVNLVIGYGVPQSNAFADINWGDGEKYLETAVDLDGGGSYTVLGVTQFLSVPFAFHSQTTETFAETDPDFNAWDKSTGIVITEGQIVDLQEYLTQEVDPDFNAWDKSTGIAITENQITDLQDYLTQEVDPEFNAWDKSTGIVITEGQIIDLKDYLTEESDPHFLASPAHGIEESDIAAWNEAHSWGDHDGLYRPADWTPSWDDMPEGVEPGEMRYWNGSEWVIVAAGLPGQFLQLSVTNIPMWGGPAFATIATNEITDILQTLATGGGNIPADGGSEVIARGIVWSTANNPSIENNDGMTIDGQGTGEFLSQLADLLPSTLYYVRAYATNFSGTDYGLTHTFTTLDPDVAVVTTSELTTIDTHTATGGGNVVYESGAPVTARGVVWSTQENPTIEVNEGITTDSTGIGAFISAFTELSPATLYNVRAYATNDVGTAYGSQLSFTTLGQIPAAVTIEATDITHQSAVLHAMINANYLTTTVSFEYGLTDEYGNTVSAEQSPVGGSTNTFVSAVIGGLETGSTYHYRVVAENELGVSYGGDMTLTPWSCGYDITFAYRGEEVTYGTIERGGLCWMDRNLGASRVPISKTDAEGYGDLFQWGRLDDGHQDRQSSTTNTLSNTDEPGHDLFITATSSPNDWRTPQNNNLWQGLEGINNPCPEGWRVPSSDELDAERLSWNSNNSSGAYDSPLKWSVGGVRNETGAFFWVGSHAAVWSYNVSGSGAGAVRYTGSGANMTSYNRAHTASLRCVKPHYLFDLNLNANPSDAGSVMGAGEYEVGELIAISATANTGWQFVNWSVGDSVVSHFASFNFNMPPEHITLTANFVEEQVGFNCGDLLIDTRDGQTYTTVLIGSQCWMAQNLNIGTMITGNQNTTDDGIIEKYCYSNNLGNCNVYGGLYQWNEMMNYSTTPFAKGICPTGWHIPSDDELIVLTTFLGGESVAGGKMKESGTTHWNSPNTGATNSSGLTALGDGFRDTNGSFDNQGIRGYWWTSSQYNASESWRRRLAYNSAQATHDTYYKSVGFSVRCLKDN
jgi:uncharacterized protein (TIGR02145 family)